jgi:hypothetical protein
MNVSVEFHCDFGSPNDSVALGIGSPSFFIAGEPSIGKDCTRD